MPTDMDRVIHKPEHTGVLIGGALMGVIGWIGLALLVMTSWPWPFQQWLFFVLVYIAVTGTSVPIAYYLNLRFTRPGHEMAPPGAILRQGIWVGMFVTTCAWLRIPRVLNWAIALLLAASLIAIEVFLRVRERSRFQP